MNFESLIIPTDAPVSNPIAPPLPDKNGFLPLLTSLSSFQVLFAVPNAVFAMNSHASKVTFLLSCKKTAPPRPVAVQFVNVTLYRYSWLPVIMIAPASPPVVFVSQWLESQPA